MPSPVENGGAPSVGRKLEGKKEGTAPQSAHPNSSDGGPVGHPPSIVTEVDGSRRNKIPGIQYGERPEPGPRQKHHGEFESSFLQARTPKHCNKTSAGENSSSDNVRKENNSSGNIVNGREKPPQARTSPHSGQPYQQHQYPGGQSDGHGNFAPHPNRSRPQSQQSGQPYPQGGRPSGPMPPQSPPRAGGPPGYGPPSQGYRNMYEGDRYSRSHYYNGGNQAGRPPPPSVLVSPGGTGYAEVNRGPPPPSSSGYYQDHGDRRGPPPHDSYRHGPPGPYGEGGPGGYRGNGPPPSSRGGPPAHPGYKGYDQQHYAPGENQYGLPRQSDKHYPVGGPRDSQPIHAYNQHGGPLPQVRHPHDSHLPPPGTGYAPSEKIPAPFTRAVSSSFDRSIRSRMSDEHGQGGAHPSPSLRPIAHPQDYLKHPQGIHFERENPNSRHERRLSEAQDDDASAASDSSWRQLNQVASVDDAAMVERIKEQKEQLKNKTDTDRKSPKQTLLKIQELPHPPSNSSSLTNSPPDGVANANKEYPPLPTPSKLKSLDSLSSVASIQEPINTTGSNDFDNNDKHRLPLPSPPSPGSSTTSIDLMKCATGSSGLLFPSQKLDDKLNKGTPEEEYGRKEKKRTREERGDTGSDERGGDEIRKAPSDLDPKHQEWLDAHGSNKRVRKDSNGKSNRSSPQKYRASPLTGSYSPPPSPGGRNREKHQARLYGNFRTSPQLHANSSYFDKAPSFSYSFELQPSNSRDNLVRNGSSHFPPRTGSPSSSTTPQVSTTNRRERRDSRDINLPFMSMTSSWDLQGQDSFGGGLMTVESGGSGGSVNGPNGAVGMLSSFSFANDYPMLGNSASNLGYPSIPRDPSQPSSQREDTSPPLPLQNGQPGPPQHGLGPPPPIVESRNQSFEGSHQHGNMNRMRSSEHEHGPQSHSDGYNNMKHRSGDGPGSPHFPAQTPSWGSSGSGAPPSHQGNAYHSQQRHFNGRTGPPGSRPPSPQRHPHHQYPGGTMRNFSEESTVSGPGYRRMGGPPMGQDFRHRPDPGRNAPSAFQPPAEFIAPHQPMMTKRPPPTVYIMSSAGGARGPGPDPMMAKNAAGGIFTWSKEDDYRLSEIMKKYKNPKDWSPVAQEHARGKSAKECHDRWIRYLKPGVRKGQWQDHEDAIVVEAVTTSTEQPFTRWSDLAQRLPGRVGKQIRDRWVNHLNPHINHMQFSREDDLLLWEGHKKLGKRWVEISTAYFNSTRSENHIKNRWYSASFKKFISHEFGPDAYSGDKSGKDKKGTGSSSPTKKSKPASTKSATTA